MFFKFSTGVSPFCLGRPPLKAVSSPGGRLAVRGPSPAAQRQLAAGPGPEASLPSKASNGLRHVGKIGQMGYGSQ